MQRSEVLYSLTTHNGLRTVVSGLRVYASALY